MMRAAFKFALVWTTIVARPVAAQSTPASDTVSLRQAIRVALVHSRVIDNAEANLQAAEQQVRAAWAQALPDVSATASYQRNLLVQQIFLPAEFFGGPAGETVPVRVGSDNSWSAGVTASQTLFEWSVFVGVGAAGRYRALQEEVVRGTTQQVVSTVRQAYFRALLAKEDLRLIRESIARVQQTLDEARARNRAGVVSDYDVLRLEVEYANVEANLQRGENAAAAAKRSLLIEMGLDPEGAVVLEGRLDRVNIEQPDSNTAEDAELLALAGAAAADGRTYDDLVQSSMRNRTDLRQLRSTVTLQEAQRSLAKADFFPKLSLFSNYNIFAQENGSPSFFGESPNQRTTTSAAGISVSLPIFKGFGRLAQVQQQTALVHQSKAVLERAQMQAENQVRTLLDAVGEARTRAASQQRAVAQAQRGYEIARAEYREGVGSQLQVTDAELALRQSEFNYAQAVYDYLNARAQLDLALGITPDAADALPVAPAR